jgi:hypothetical protein
MNARVKQDYRWNAITAFSGIEFVKGEYRQVPAGSEAEATAHDALEIEAEAKQPAEAKLPAEVRPVPPVLDAPAPKAPKAPAKNTVKK